MSDQRADGEIVQLPAKTPSVTVSSLVSVLLLAGGDHAAQLELARELAADLAEELHDGAARLNQADLGGNLAVRLDAQEELGHVWVADCIAIPSDGGQRSANDMGSTQRSRYPHMPL